LEPFLEVVHFARWPAIIAGTVVGVLTFQGNAGGGFWLESALKSALSATGIALMAFLLGAVTYQRMHVVFPRRDALISGALLTLPVMIFFIGSAATSMKPSAEVYFAGAIAFIVGWLVFTLFAFCVIFFVPRVVGAVRPPR
jgi:hypothetical protein